MKRILVTGNTGYIGAVLVPMLESKGYQTIGLDTGFYRGCEYGEGRFAPSRQINMDIRDVEISDLEGVFAVVHLAALSNDPLGELNPSVTQDINSAASLRLAEAAKAAGAKRFVFASSCSLYGAGADDAAMSETGKLAPMTTYARSKIYMEQRLSKLADGRFHPVYLRNATVYGVSPMLRQDLVVNNLIACAHVTGRITVLSDGSPWRPLVHVEDACRAIIASLEAPEESIHDQALNVGRDRDNYRVKEIAALIREHMPWCQIEIRGETSSDARSYRVDFGKIRHTLPLFEPSWDLRRGIEQIASAYRASQLTRELFESDRFFRIRRIRSLLDRNRIGADLRWTS